MKNTISRIALGILVLTLCFVWPGIDYSGITAAAAGEQTTTDSKYETIEGELEIIAECEETDGRILYFVDTGKERIKVNFASEPEQELTTGMRVAISGVRRGSDEFAADERSLAIRSGQPEAASAIAGEIKVLVFLVNFQNDPVQPYTIAQANNLMFNQANGSSVTNYYREASYGQAWVTGDTVGWFTLPMDASTAACDQNSTIASLGREAATNAGINVNNYQKHMFVFPNMGCSYAGRGQLGGRDSWIDGSLILRTTAHELGHTLGLYHSKAMSCSNVLSGTCVTTEYGHNADMVGQTGVTGHYHPYQKERLGWLAPGSGVVTVQGAGTYTISGLSVQDNNPKALRIQQNSSNYYYVEFRRPVGFDSFVSGNSNTMNGVLITQNSSASSNFLLDMVPSTASWSDAALQVGQSFTDPNTNMTITVQSVSSSGAVVNISYGSVPCVMAAPTVNANPSATQWIAPGASISYTMSVTNNNSSNCSMNSFNVGANVPTGWSFSAASPTLSVAPGSTASAVIQVTAPASAAAGTYGATMSASNVQSSNYSASVNRSLAVLASISVSVVTSQALYAPNQQLSASATVTAGGSPVAGATVYFVAQRLGAKEISGSAVTNASGVATFTYRFNKKRDGPGMYSLSAGTTFNGMSGSGSTSFEVR